MDFGGVYKWLYGSYMGWFGDFRAFFKLGVIWMILEGVQWRLMPNEMLLGCNRRWTALGSVVEWWHLHKRLYRWTALGALERSISVSGV